MLDIPRAVLNYSWAQSLFGVRQVVAALAPRGEGVTAACRTVNRATASQLGRTLGAVHGVGELVQNEALDLLTRVAGNPVAAARLPADVGRRGLDAVRVLLSDRDRRSAAEEVRNKVLVFRWVRNVRDLLGIPPGGGRVALADLLARAYALDPFQALWAVEGAGHEYAAAALDCDPDPKGLLAADSAAVPDESLTMLNAGIGLAFAERQLAELSPSSPPAVVRAAAERFLAQCRSNVREGYLGAAVESLGLVARVFHPRGLVPAVDRELADLDADARPFFWHGVGRGLYFSASYFLPVVTSAWEPLLSGSAEAPDPLARSNAVAGLAWATTMVNLRTPGVVAGVVARHGPELVRDGAFANGVGSAVVMRADTTPGEPFIAQFCEADPGPSARPYWDELVRGPCRAAVGVDRRALRSAGRMGDLFRYQPAGGRRAGDHARATEAARWQPRA
jgi:hypothetical protein